MKTINLALSTDNKYIENTAAVIYSILSNIAPNIFCQFYILSSNLSASKKRRLEKLSRAHACAFSFIKPPATFLSIFKKIQLPPHINIECFNRLFLPLILPHINRILYLDSDLVILKDLSPLYFEELNGNYFAAVEDVNPTLKKQLGYPSQYGYYNSGVLLMDIRALQRINYLSILNKSVSERYTKYPVGGDQDILNDCFHDKIKPLSYAWNMFHEWHGCKKIFTPSNQSDYIQSVKNPAIIHFVGPVKPWQPGCKRPYTEQYLAYAQNCQKELGSFTPFSFLKIDKIKTNQIRSKRISLCGVPIFYKEKTPQSKSVKICGLPIYTRSSSKEYKIFHVLGIPFKRKIKSPFYCDKSSFNILLRDLSTTFWNSGEAERICERQIAVARLHKEVFSKYKNCFQDREMVLMASGPSVKKYIRIENAIHVGVNRSFLNEQIPLDFLFIQDKRAFANGKEAILKYKGNDVVKFFGILNEKFQDWIIPESWALQCHALRYYTDNGFSSRFAYDITSQRLGDFSSVVFSALQFMLFCNPHRIYLVGCDCSNEPYFYDPNQKTDLIPSRNIANFQRFKEFATVYYPDTEIISVNPVGLKGMFPEISNL